MLGCRSASTLTTRTKKVDSSQKFVASQTRVASDLAVEKPNEHVSETLSQEQVSTTSNIVPTSVTVVLASSVSNANDVSVQASENTPEQEARPREVYQISEEIQSIDLTTALMLTTGKNPQIAFAQARIEESLAQIDRANALKLPSIRAGMNYHKHEGQIQDVAGTMINTSRGSYYSGLGASAVGAGSPAVPGLISQFHFADAIFQPRIAQRTACARQAGAKATTNDLLLATAIAYTELLRCEQDLAIARDIVDHAEQLSTSTERFAKVGEGLESDFDRARTELALRRSELIRAEELAAVASTRLAELIRWDSVQRLVPSEMQITPIEMMDRSAVPRELVSMALSNRPELAESRHLVGEAVERLNREKNAPLVPSVALSASYGLNGGGLGSTLGDFGDRLDADAVAFWEVRQFGFGEKAIRKESRSRIMQARMQEIAQMDRIAREVTEAYAQVHARSQQIEVIKDGVEAAGNSFTKNWDRIQNGQGLPIEVLQSIQALAATQREYVRVVADYNVAQFTLQRALGWPIQGVDVTDFSE
jgi:outer membrane protein TolC